MKGAGILGIPNRTENWLTASIFIPLIVHNRQNELAAWIIKNAKGTQVSFGPGEVSLELYWKGFRDYCSQKGDEKPSQEETVARYRECFSNLSEKICEYNRQDESQQQKFRSLRPHNYVCPEESLKSAKSLYSNLLNTEIDIVLSTPGYLLIGEAKHEETFGTDSRLVLVHQLIRQYVMASILADMIGDNCRNEAKKEIIPFIVCDYPSKTTKTAQVQFLHQMKWLCLENVISWEDMHRLVTE